MVFKKIKQQIKIIKSNLQKKSLRPGLEPVCLSSQELALPGDDLTRVAVEYEKQKSEKLLNVLLSRLDFNEPTHAAIALPPLLRALDKGELPEEATRQVTAFLENEAFSKIVKHAETFHPSLDDQLKQRGKNRLEIVS